MNLDATISQASSKEISRKPLWKRMLLQKELQLMVLPGILYLVLFELFPIYGIQLAFKELIPVKGIWGSPWVGLKHFDNFFYSGSFGKVMYNTLALSALKIIFCFPVPILFALLLNEIKRLRMKSLIQGISYLPHFISWVICSGVLMSILSKDGGTINVILMKLGLVKEPIFFMGETKFFWPLMVLFDNWKEMGWSAIIYIAAISGIDTQMYEASRIDGAGRFKQAIYITLPSIISTIVILLILRVGHILSAGFQQLLVFKNPLVADAANILDVHVYETGIAYGRYGYATAVGLFKSIISFILVWGTNKIAQKGNMGIW